MDHVRSVIAEARECREQVLQFLCLLHHIIGEIDVAADPFLGNPVEASYLPGVCRHE
jgi:hypothetical protein